MIGIAGVTRVSAQGTFESAPYTYKVRNWQPADFGVDARSWEAVLSLCDERIDENAGDLDALLLRAVAYREFGVRRALLLRARDWRRSEADFEELFRRDSTVHDLHFQYAQLKRYQGEFERALILMHTQLTLRPDLPYVAPALLRLYRQFILEKEPDEVRAWLDAHPSGYATYFSAEIERREGKAMEADSMLSALLRRRRGMPYQPVLLGRARIYYAIDRPAIAQSYVMQAIESIDDASSGRLVGEDFKYVFTDEEAAQYISLQTPEAFKSFYYAMWERRNPARSEEVNRRLNVHYLRLMSAEDELAYYAPREAYRIMNNVRMDRMADRDFPEAYWLNAELGDKGLIFVRHGPPSSTANSTGENVPYIESWRYVNPDMDFHFEGFSNLAELIPTLPLDLNTLEAREIWGGDYARLTQAIRQRDGLLRVDRSQMNQMDLMVFNNEIFDQSLKDAREGLTSDRHRWLRELHHLDVPHVLAAFRGSEGNTRLEVHYAIPIGQVAPELETVGEQLEIKVGIALDDSMWNPVWKSYESLKTPAAADPSIVAIDFFMHDVPPDSYHVNLHAQINDSGWLGSYQFDYRVRDMSGDELLVSDLLPAVNVTPTGNAGRYVRNGLLIQANPKAGYTRDEPLFVYFEIYNLTFGSDDRTRYTITYSLNRAESDRSGLRLFRRKRDEALSITYEREGADRTSIEYGEIDMSAVPAGVYDLTVTVVDRTTGEETATSRTISLED